MTHERALAALALFALTALLARTTLTDLRASRFAVLAGGLVAATAFVVSKANAWGGALFLASLLLRARPEPAARLAPLALLPAIALLSPAVAVAALVAASAWEGARAWQPVAEAVLVAAVLLARGGFEPYVAILLTSSALVLGALLRRSGPVGRIPSRRATLAALGAGGVVALLSLLALDSFRPFAPADEPLRALGLGLAAAAAGAVGALAPMGALCLLGVRDEARRVLLVALGGAALAGLVSMGAALVVAAAAAALAWGAGAERTWRLGVPGPRPVAVG